MMAISTAHSASQLQALGFDYPMIPGSPSGSSINSTYSISQYPTVILIAPNKNIIEKDIWPISNTILRSKITNAGGTPTTCPTSDVTEAQINGISIFPNPAEDVLNISSGRDVMIKLFDLMGKQIDRILVAENAVYNCAHLDAGIYLLRVFDMDGQHLSTQKMMKK
jgi:hypothetical protein